MQELNECGIEPRQGAYEACMAYQCCINDDLPGVKAWFEKGREFQMNHTKDGHFHVDFRHGMQGEGVTLLHMASSKGQIDIMDYAIHEEGALVDLGDANERTSLHYATIHGRVDAVKYLLGLGASRTKRDFWNENAWDHTILFESDKQIHGGTIKELQALVLPDDVDAD